MSRGGGALCNPPSLHALPTQDHRKRKLEEGTSCIARNWWPMDGFNFLTPATNATRGDVWDLLLVDPLGYGPSPWCNVPCPPSAARYIALLAQPCPWRGLWCLESTLDVPSSVFTDTLGLSLGLNSFCASYFSGAVQHTRAMKLPSLTYRTSGSCKL